MRLLVYFYIFTIRLYSLDVIINFRFFTASPKHIYKYKSEVMFCVVYISIHTLISSQYKLQHLYVTVPLLHYSSSSQIFQSSLKAEWLL